VLSINDIIYLLTTLTIIHEENYYYNNHRGTYLDSMMWNDWPFQIKPLS